MLALIPKCPACLAAYIALGTGIGVSFPMADHLRIGLIFVSIAILGWLSFSLIRGYIERILRHTTGKHGGIP